VTLAGFLALTTMLFLQMSVSPVTIIKLLDNDLGVGETRVIIVREEPLVGLL